MDFAYCSGLVCSNFEKYGHRLSGSPIHRHHCKLRMAARWGIEFGRRFANAERGLCVEPYFRSARD
jgi:hypothetical protein